MKKICILSPHQLNLVSGGKNDPFPTQHIGPYPPEGYPTGSKKIGNNITITPIVVGNSSGAMGTAKFDYSLTKNLDVSATLGLGTNYHNFPKVTTNLNRSSSP